MRTDTVLTDAFRNAYRMRPP